MREPSNRYDLSAARSHGQSGRIWGPPGIGRAIDIHTHVLIEDALDVVRPHLQPDPRAVLLAEETRILNRRQDEDRRPNLVNLTLRIRDAESMGLHAQVISPAPGQCHYDLPPEIGIEAARRINNGIAAMVAARPQQIPAGLGTVPLGAGGEAAAAELAHCVNELHLKGVEVLAHVGERELSDPAFEPFWAKASELGAVVFIHPAGFTEPRRFGRHYFNNVIGNPLDTTLALHHLIFDGVLERYPDLKIIAAHGGGFLPAYSGRIDHAWGARSDAHGTLPHPPSHYLRRIYLDSVVFTPHQLEALVALSGADRILLGTDYPYDMGEYDPLGHLAAASLTEADRVAIAGGNAQALFGL